MIGNNAYEFKLARLIESSNPVIYDIPKLLYDAIASVVYGHNPEVDQSTCTYELGEFKYFHTEPIWNPNSLYTVGYDNGSNSQDSVVLKRSESTTATFSWSITEGIKIGAKTTIQAGIPKIVDGKIELSTELSLSSTQTKTESKTQTWEVNTNITIPPWTHIDANLIMRAGEQNANFEVDITCGGYATSKWKGPNGKIVTGEASQAAFLHNYANIPYKSYMPPTGRDFRGELVVTMRGTFKGVQGVGVEVIKKSRAIPHVSNIDKLENHLLIQK